MAAEGAEVVVLEEEKTAADSLCSIYNPSSVVSVQGLTIGVQV